MPRASRIAVTLARAWLGGVARSRFGFAPAAERRAAFAAATRRAFEELGPAFVKLGQFASVRPDVFPSELVFELAKLQDAVPPIPLSEVRRIITEELGRPPEEVFASFDPVPLAAASIAQVHAATLAEEVRPVWGAPLPAGAEVAVKVVRPGAAEAIEADVAVARRLLRMLRRAGRTRRVDAERLLDEFHASLRREVDLRNEGRVADRFAFDFRDDPLVVVPRVAWPLSTRRVLTMERIEGWRLTELRSADLAGVDGRALAEHGAVAFMRQVLVLGRFHADLHPANIFVTPDSRIAYLDFGIVGTLTAEEREAIAQVLAGLVYLDADRALRWSQRLGVRIPPESEARVREEVAALMRRTLAEEPDVRHFGMGFLSLLGRQGIEIPVGYGLLVKSLVTVEGVARALYPDIDIIATAGPFVTALLARRALSPARLHETLPRALGAAVREMMG